MHLMHHHSYALYCKYPGVSRPLYFVLFKLTVVIETTLAFRQMNAYSSSSKVIIFLISN